jgi:hypothetical protein
MLQDPLASRLKLRERSGQIVEHARGSDFFGAHPDTREFFCHASYMLRVCSLNVMLRNSVSHFLQQNSVPLIIIGSRRPTIEIDEGDVNGFKDGQNEGGTGEPQAVPEHQLTSLAVDANVGAIPKSIRNPICLSAVVPVMDETTHPSYVIDFFILKGRNYKMVRARLRTRRASESLMPKHGLNEQFSSDSVQYPSVRSIVGRHDKQR